MIVKAWCCYCPHYGLIYQVSCLPLVGVCFHKGTIYCWWCLLPVQGNSSGTYTPLFQQLLKLPLLVRCVYPLRYLRLNRCCLEVSIRSVSEKTWQTTSKHFQVYICYKYVSLLVLPPLGHKVMPTNISMNCIYETNQNSSLYLSVIG